MNPDDIRLSDSLEGFEGWDKRVHAPDHREVNTAFVSLRVGGAIGINKAAWQMFGRPEAVRLMFDSDRRRIGLAPAEVDDPRAWVNRYPNEPITLPAKRFCEHYGILPAETRRYTPKLIDGVMVVEL